MNFFKNLFKPKEENIDKYFFIHDLHRFVYKNLVREQLKILKLSYVTIRDEGYYFALEVYETALQPQKLLHTIYISRDGWEYFADANGLRYFPKTTGGYLDQKCLLYFQKTRTAIKNEYQIAEEILFQ